MLVIFINVFYCIIYYYMYLCHCIIRDKDQRRDKIITLCARDLCWSSLLTYFIVLYIVICTCVNVLFMFVLKDGLYG